MILQSSADDLSLVIEIFRADKSNYAVDQKWLEDAGHAVCARL